MALKHAFTKQNEKKLETFEMCCYRRMQRVSWRKIDEMNKFLRLSEEIDSYWKEYLKKKRTVLALEQYARLRPIIGYQSIIVWSSKCMWNKNTQISSSPSPSANRPIIEHQSIIAGSSKRTNRPIIERQSVIAWFSKCSETRILRSHFQYLH